MVEVVRDRRREASAIVAILLALALAFPTGVLAAETATCSDAYQNRWSGQNLTGGQKHGASGRASATVLNLCTSPIGLSVDLSVYFSNITPTTGSHFNDIVQIGYGKCRSPNCPDSNTLYYYWAWGRDDATPGCEAFADQSPLLWNAGTWASGAHTFGVNHVSNQYRGYVDGVIEASAPESGVCWTPAKALWFGETLDFGDQLGGVLASKLHVTLTTYQSSEGGTFTYTTFNASQACNYQIPGNPPAPYFCDLTGTSSLDLWTDR